MGESPNAIFRLFVKGHLKSGHNACLRFMSKHFGGGSKLHIMYNIVQHSGTMLFIHAAKGRAISGACGYDRSVPLESKLQTALLT